MGRLSEGGKRVGLDKGERIPRSPLKGGQRKFRGGEGTSRRSEHQNLGKCKKMALNIRERSCSRGMCIVHPNG